MFFSYFKTALRNLTKNRMATMMNFFGLSVGFIGCLFISLYIVGEYQYDRSFENTDRLYRVVTTYEDMAGGKATTEGPVALAPALVEEYAEVEAATTMLKTDKGFLFAGEKSFRRISFLQTRVLRTSLG